MPSFMTRVSDGMAEGIDNANALTRDTVILVREAVHRAVSDDLRGLELIQTGKDFNVEVRVRR